MSQSITLIILQKIRKMIKMVMSFNKLKEEVGIIIWEIKGCQMLIQGMEASSIWQTALNKINQRNKVLVSLAQYII